MTFWNRQTYSLLDLLRDLGGLYNALRLIALIATAPASKFAMNVLLATSLLTLKGEQTFGRQRVEPRFSKKSNFPPKVSKIDSGQSQSKATQ